jgi:hypothetical protein
MMKAGKVRRVMVKTLPTRWHLTKVDHNKTGLRVESASSNRSFKRTANATLYRKPVSGNARSNPARSKLWKIDNKALLVSAHGTRPDYRQHKQERGRSRNGSVLVRWGLQEAEILAMLGFEGHTLADPTGLHVDW